MTDQFRIADVPPPGSGRAGAVTFGRWLTALRRGISAPSPAMIVPAPNISVPHPADEGRRHVRLTSRGDTGRARRAEETVA